MHIVTASNDQYAKHLGVMLYSLLVNLDKKSQGVTIHIIDGNISDQNKSKLKKIVESFHSYVQFMTIDENLFNSFKNEKIKYISNQTYYRICVPDLLSNDITKALYIDCDIIVQKDISPLWQVNLDDYFLAAVAELGEQFLRRRKKRLGIPVESGYFNAGLLLINLKKWREHHIPTQIIDYIKSNPDKVKLMDQDGLNAILKEKWLELDPTWNYTTDIQERLVIDKPAIIHFTGPAKPWNSKPPYNEEYVKYLNLSQWEKEK